MSSWNCFVCKEYKDGNACTFCDNGSKFKRMTNADRMRNMTDEELAEFLEGFTVCDHCEYYKNERCTMENPCVHAFAEAMAQKWLQEEVEEGE